MCKLHNESQYHSDSKLLYLKRLRQKVRKCALEKCLKITQKVVYMMMNT